MLIVNTKLPKLCHARQGDVVQLPDESGEPNGTLYLVCVFSNGRRPMRKAMFQGLYDDERPLFLVNLENGEAVKMPHLSSRVKICRDVYLVNEEEQ